jgi:6-phosphofructokinase 1
MDRVLASRMGVEAVKALISGKFGVMVGIVNKDQILYTPLDKAAKHNLTVNRQLLDIATILSSVW